MKVVGFLTVKPSFWLMAKPEIKSMAELKGKIIGITAIGSSTDTLARFLVSKNGLVPDRDVAFLGTGTTANILTAMKAGTVDAGVLSPPFNAFGKQLGYRTLAYFGDYVEQSLSGLGTSDKMIRDRPELVKRMLIATIKEPAVHPAAACRDHPVYCQGMERRYARLPMNCTNRCCRHFPKTAAWTRRASAMRSSARPSG